MPGDTLFVITHEFDGDNGAVGSPPEFTWKRVGDKIRMVPVAGGTSYEHRDTTPMLREGFNFVNRFGQATRAFGTRVGPVRIVDEVPTTFIWRFGFSYVHKSPYVIEVSGSQPDSEAGSVTEREEPTVVEAEPVRVVVPAISVQPPQRVASGDQGCITVPGLLRICASPLLRMLKQLCAPYAFTMCSAGPIDSWKRFWRVTAGAIALYLAYRSMWWAVAKMHALFRQGLGFVLAPKPLTLPSMGRSLTEDEEKLRIRLTAALPGVKHAGDAKQLCRSMSAQFHVPLDTVAKILADARPGVASTVGSIERNFEFDRISQLGEMADSLLHPFQFAQSWYKALTTSQLAYKDTLTLLIHAYWDTSAVHRLGENG